MAEVHDQVSLAGSSNGGALDVDSKSPNLDSKSDSLEQSEDVKATVYEAGLQRGIGSKAMTMIALGSIVGPGCLWGLGYALALVGPVGALLSFSIVGAIVWVLMQSLGEVTTLFPIHGGFVEHAGLFADPALSFAMSWLYFLMWAFFLGSDWNSASLVLGYWVPTHKFPQWAWSPLFWMFFNVLCTFGVDVFGKVEFWFSCFKFFILFVLYFIAILADVGAFGKGYVGFRYWAEPGPFLNGVNGFGQCFTLAAAYYVGTEIVAIAAGESKHPRRDVPKGINTITFRILFVFIGLIFFQGLICPSDSPDLLTATSKTAASPFSIGYALAGWATAPHFVNAVILGCFFSAGNGVVFVLSRTLHTLALKGRAPKFFAATTKKGVPVRAILFSNLWGFTSLMNINAPAGAIFAYISTATGTAAYIAWIVIVFIHLRVRLAAKRQGISPDTFPFKAPGHIAIYYVTLALLIFILVIQGYTAFLHPFNWRMFVAGYISFPTFIILFVGYKFWHKTKWVSINDIDLSQRLRWDALGEAPIARESRLKRAYKSFFVG